MSEKLEKLLTDLQKSQERRLKQTNESITKARELDKALNGKCKYNLDIAVYGDLSVDVILQDNETIKDVLKLFTSFRRLPEDKPIVSELMPRVLYSFDGFSLWIYMSDKDGAKCEYVQDGVKEVPKYKVVCH
jgi:hypothetical protein